jgi:hypothetical protein
MRALQPEQGWDPVEEEKKWCTSLESARQFQEKLDKEFRNPLSGFLRLCLAELDAGNQMLASGCFSSRASFLAEVRRLISEPTTPSRPVDNLEAYRSSQKWWLEFIISQYDSTLSG